MIIGLLLNSIKTYKAGHFIPIASKKNNKLACYFGENGTGKSSILEALNSFFYAKEYNINNDKDTRKDRAYCVPIFLLEKEIIDDNNSDFEEQEKAIIRDLSEYFYSITPSDVTNIENRSHLLSFMDSMKEYKDDFYLFAMGENVNRDVHFGIFNNAPFCKGENNLLENQGELKNIIKKIKNLYTYIYVPVEISINDFANWTNFYLPTLCNTDLKTEINKAISDDVFASLGQKLKQFLKNTTKKMNKNKNEIYKFDDSRQRARGIKKQWLINSIISGYFSGIELFRERKPINHLSAGEKRQTILDLCHTFLTNEDSVFDTKIIFAMDEPENSLNLKLYYEQFLKIQEISKNIQTFITTHWYGFAPILQELEIHILQNNDSKISFNSYHDEKSRTKYFIKSINDLAMSVYYSLKNGYRWIICEGYTDKIYLDYFLNNLSFDDLYIEKLYILELSGCDNVIKIYNFLSVILNNVKERDNLVGRIVCLLDADADIKDSSNNDIKDLLCKYQFKNTGFISNAKQEIEDELNELIKREAMENLNLNLPKQDKVKFAKEYIRIMEEKDNKNNYIPKFINDISKFLRASYDF